MSEIPVSPKDVLTNEEYYKASNNLQYLLGSYGKSQPGYRKEAVIFIQDQETEITISWALESSVSKFV